MDKVLWQEGEWEIVIMYEVRWEIQMMLDEVFLEDLEDSFEVLEQDNEEGDECDLEKADEDDRVVLVKVV